MQALMAQAERIGEQLKARKERVAVAESSSGGLISAALLSVPGASAYYLGGGVVYTPKARVMLMDIPREALEGMRSASEPYALLLARTVRELPAILREDVHSAEFYTSAEVPGFYQKIFGASNQLTADLVTGLAAASGNGFRILEVGEIARPLHQAEAFRRIVGEDAERQRGGITERTPQPLAAPGPDFEAV